MESNNEKNTRLNELVQQLLDYAWDYSLNIRILQSGAKLIDAGIEAEGSYEAGRIITEICQGGLCRASLGLANMDGIVLPQITVESFHPTLSAYDFQAGSAVKGKIVSGPINMYLKKDALRYKKLSYIDKTTVGIAIIQSDDIPTNEWALSLAEQSHLHPKDLYLIVMPMRSIVGVTQITGRMNENVIFSLEESISYNSLKVKHIIGNAPICPVTKENFKKRKACPDDFIHYAAQIFLTLDADPDENLQKLAEALSFQSTPIYGEFFSDILSKAKGNFMDIPKIKDINKVAQVTINDFNTGRVYQAGKKNTALLREFLSSVS
ncbi:MAG: hypothetical protein NTZ83_05830 [Candidatus Pacearchaeota archaeon]|nr:hypothetical protein [Candidatus Pacearchaeota archaeon]